MAGEKSATLCRGSVKLPSIVGFSETPFWPGRKDDRALKLAPLWKDYFERKFAYEIG
ncbi:MAG: hypothetical protein KIH08_00880 [Candidatus Freyarchaeota archaeon]|nr:hypothetical protein [Candidatus Jordarchaeia archaeon]